MKEPIVSYEKGCECFGKIDVRVRVRPDEPSQLVDAGMESYAFLAEPATTDVSQRCVSGWLYAVRDICEAIAGEGIDIEEAIRRITQEELPAREWRVRIHGSRVYSAPHLGATAEEALHQWAIRYERDDDSCHIANEGSVEVEIAPLPRGGWGGLVDEWRHFRVSGLMALEVEVFEIRKQKGDRDADEPGDAEAEVGVGD